ncbi:MAG: Smr/MutS family protein [Bacteroidota bacterium]|nr:Smr/MutS family protein [Bacteroidota bacterium]
MNIGDRVRLLHGKEQGIITQFIGNDQVEIAIDNDFTIPVLRREVVVIAEEEDKYLKNVGVEQPAKEIRKNEPAPLPVTATAGIYVALVPQTEELLAVNVINYSDFDLLFTYGEDTNNRYRGIISDKLTPKNSKVVSHLHLKDFDKWPDLVIQYLQHRVSGVNLLEPVVKRIKFKASSFYKSKKMAPVVKKEAYLFSLDQKPIEINPAQILENLTESETKNPEAYQLKMPSHEVDLHIEKLTDVDPALMSNSEILRTQLAVFQDNLDRAIATNMHEIVFIHGTGNGVLRKEIQKILSQRRSHIKYYEDARKERFGFGATLVRLK